MSNKDREVKAMHLLQLPTKQINFLRRNPVLAEELGQIMIAITEIDLAKQDLLKILADTELIKNHLQDGSEEELKEFISEALKAQQSALKFDNLPKGAYQQVKEQLGDRLLATDINLSSKPEIASNKEVD